MPCLTNDVMGSVWRASSVVFYLAAKPTTALICKYALIVRHTDFNEAPYINAYYRPNGAAVLHSLYTRHTTTL